MLGRAVTCATARVALPAARPLAAVAIAPTRTFVRPTPVLQIPRKKWWRRLLKKRYHPTDQPADPFKLTLFNQSMLPEDLRLPTPGDPIKRIAAGALDATVSIAGGAVVGGIVHLTAGTPELAIAAAQGGALCLWMLRDALSDAGNRSFGKRMFDLELTNWDGTLVSRSHAILRNWYCLLVPLSSLHPLLEMTTTVLGIFDIGSFVLTQDARKVGDYMFGTRVVNERPGRETRILDAEETDEIRQLREEIEELAPGKLASQEVAAQQPWYEVLQKDIEAGLASDSVVQRAAAPATSSVSRPAAAPRTVPATAPPVLDLDDVPSFAAAEVRNALRTVGGAAPSSSTDDSARQSGGDENGPRVTASGRVLLVNKPAKSPSS